MKVYLIETIKANIWPRFIRILVTICSDLVRISIEFFGFDFFCLYMVHIEFSIYFAIIFFE